MPVIAVATQTDIIPKTISNIVEVKSRGAKVILVCTDACARELKEGVADYVIELPHTEELLMPITAVVPLQLFGILHFGKTEELTPISRETWQNRLRLNKLI